MAKKKRTISVSNLILLFGGIVIVLPIVIWLWILISASLKVGTPILGDRYKNDLNPAITKQEMSTIKKDVTAIEGVKQVEVDLVTATLRVYADVEDVFKDDKVTEIAKSIYQKVLSVLDVNTYFSQHDNMKMYDLEIHVYNLEKNRDSEDFAYVILTKTSSMESEMIQLVSQPIDAQLAQQLRDAVEARKNPQKTDTPQSTQETVGSSETEDDNEAE